MVVLSAEAGYSSKKMEETAEGEKMRLSPEAAREDLFLRRKK